MDWYIKSAEQGYSSARKSLESMRKRSDSVRLGTAEPKWWEIPEAELMAKAEDGDSESQYHMGLRFEGYGGTVIYLDQSRHWLSLAAAQTNLSAHASLATSYECAVRSDFKKAFEHCQIAAQGGNSSAEYILGRYYRAGVGVAVDRVRR